jgi:hypothetical protein
MGWTAFALGLTYIVLAVVHGRAIEIDRRHFWTKVHCIVLTVMGTLYMLTGAGVLAD